MRCCCASRVKGYPGIEEIHAHVHQAVRGSGMTDSGNILFKTLAARYLWWMMPDEALKRPERIVVQVMNLGDFADVTAVLDAVGEDQARELLTHAEAGQFSPRSWHYWHYRLGLAEPDCLPPMPTRRVC